MPEHSVIQRPPSSSPRAHRLTSPQEEDKGEEVMAPQPGRRGPALMTTGQPRPLMTKLRSPAGPPRAHPTSPRTEARASSISSLEDPPSSGQGRQRERSVVDPQQLTSQRRTPAQRNQPPPATALQPPGPHQTAAVAARSDSLRSILECRPSSGAHEAKYSTPARPAATPGRAPRERQERFECSGPPILGRL